MSFYDNDNTWSAQNRQPSWEQQPPPSRSGTASVMSQAPETNAFASQFEEIDRATDNLMKSGKWFPGAMQPGPVAGMPSRRDSMPVAGDPRMGGGASRHHSVSEFEGGQPGSAGLQGYYQGQRFPARQSEAEQMLQAKRRMAAQRERELRNYHQEQQYNRKSDVSGQKSERAMSPNTMSEEDRRELIARQHRALYGDTSSLYSQQDGSTPRPGQDARVSSSGRGQSPLSFDSFGLQSQPGASDVGVVQMPTRGDERTNSTASPASNPAQQQQPFQLLGEAQQQQQQQQQQSNRNSTSSPSGSPPLTQGHQQKVSGQQPGGVAPIGTRPTQPAQGLNKRSTTPLTPSSLSYGFSAQDSGISAGAGAKDERSTSAASNPALADKAVAGLGSAWGAGSGGWGNKLGVQASVWG